MKRTLAGLLLLLLVSSPVVAAEETCTRAWNPDEQAWHSWWWYSRRSLVDVRGAARAIAPWTGETDLDHARRDATAALLAVARDGARYDDERSVAVSALARLPGAKDHEALYLSLADPEKESGVELRRYALLALGLAAPRTERARAFLLGALTDARRSDRERAWAALAVGLVGDRSTTVRAGLTALLEGPAAEEDVRVCAIIALGMLSGPAQVPGLSRWLAEASIGERPIGDVEKSWIAGAIGRAGGPGAAAALLDALEGRSVQTRRAAALALGRVLPSEAPGPRAEALRRIAARIDADGDAATRRFLLVALGRIGAAPEADTTLRAECERIVAATLSRDDRLADHPHAVVALGILGRDAPAADRERLADRVLADAPAFADDPVSVAAHAAALGLLGDRRPPATKLLLGMLRDYCPCGKYHRRWEMRRRHAATALALTGAPGARAAIRAALADEHWEPLFPGEAYPALVLLGDGGVAPEVADRVLSRGRRVGSERHFAITTLAEVGDARTVPVLLEVLRSDPKESEYNLINRECAGLALASILGPPGPTVHERIFTDANYLAIVPSLRSLPWQW